MSFCFNFDVPAQTINTNDVDGNGLQSGKKDNAVTDVSNVSSLIIFWLSYSEDSKLSGCQIVVSSDLGFVLNFICNIKRKDMHMQWHVYLYEVCGL